MACYEFLARVMARLQPAEAAHEAAGLVYVPRLADDAPGLQDACRGVVGHENSDFLVGASSVPARSREGLEAFAARLRRVARTLDAIRGERPAQRRARYARNHGFVPADIEPLLAAVPEATWAQLAGAWARLSALWDAIVAHLPNFSAVCAYLHRIDPDAFWRAYWHWMLHPEGGHDAAADAFLAALPRSPLFHNAPACQAALARELRRMGSDWSRLHTERARLALIATGTVIEPAPDVFERLRAL